MRMRVGFSAWMATDPRKPKHHLESRKKTSEPVWPSETPPNRESLYRPLRLDNLTLPGNLIMAPMAGYTDRPFRSLAWEGGASAAFTEMASAVALARQNGKTVDILRSGPGEPFLGVQLFGADEESMARARDIAVESGAAFIDLNAGCPVPKVTRTGAGAALGNDIPRLCRLIAVLREGGVPVTVKIRSGWDDASTTWQIAARAAAESGAAAVTIHPRTRRQGYGGQADHRITASLADELPVPVIASGDLFTPGDIARILRETGAAGAMVARGALGNPGIFARTRTLLEIGKEPPPPGREERLEGARTHLKRALADDGTRGLSEEWTIRRMRKHLAAWAKGWEGAASLRHNLVRGETAAEVLALLDRAERGLSTTATRSESMR